MIDVCFQNFVLLKLNQCEFSGNNPDDLTNQFGQLEGADSFRYFCAKFSR